MAVNSGQLGAEALALTKPTVPVIYAAQLVQLAARFSVSEADALEGTGVERAQLEDPSHKLSAMAMATLAARVIHLTREPGLGFYYGLHLKLPSHGAVGLAAMTSATLRDAIGIAERYVSLRTPHLTFRHYVEGDQGVLQLIDSAPHGVLRVFMTEALFTALAQMVRALLGRQVTAVFEMTFAEPHYFQGFAHLLPGPARFLQRENRALFPAALLDESLQMADAISARQALARCEEELLSLAETSSLLASVRTQMASRRAGFPSLSDLAAQRHVSPRTLKRQLATHGTSFQTLLDELRRDRALSLLDDPQQSLERIAEYLGYSDTSNFNRAFRRWMGCTPSTWRAKSARGEPG